jgi:hypothetical protein
MVEATIGTLLGTAPGRGRERDIGFLVNTTPRRNSVDARTVASFLLGLD